MISNKYILNEKIAEGKFGKVFKGKNIRTNEDVAIKVEITTGDLKTLKNEAKIYHYLRNLDGFPTLKWYGTNNNISYLVINLLGISLTTLIKERILNGNANFLLNIAIQIIQRIHLLHENYLIHRDIKPDNFLFGLENTNKIYLIDFGFCKRYYNEKHMEQKNINSIIGSLNFVSLNVHNGIEPSRRDDLESCVYIILNMIIGKLEWSDETNNDKIIKYKLELEKRNDIPLFIRLLLKYIRNIRFDETPNYQYCIDLIKSMIV